MTNEMTTVGGSTIPEMISNHARRTLDQFSTVDEGRNVVINRKPTMIERQILSKRSVEIDSLLTPIERSEQKFIVPNEKGGTDTLSAFQYVGQLLALFFGNYTSMRGGDPRPTIAAYRKTLRSVPAWALERALDAIASDSIRVPDGRGGDKPMDRNFAPAAPQVLAVARTFIDDLYEENNKIIRVLRASIVESIPDAEARKASIPRVQKMADQAKAILSKVSPEDSARLADAERRNAEALAERTRRSNAAALLEYKELGIEPVMAGDLVISPELVRQLDAGRLARK